MLAGASQHCRTNTHTQTQQTKWSCECSVAWNHGCFPGQRRLLRVPLPLEWCKIFRSFSPSSRWRGQSPCQQDERNASVTVGPNLNVCFCLPLSLLSHSRCLRPSTGITLWKWASTCPCSCASLWTSSGKWVRREDVINLKTHCEICCLWMTPDTVAESLAKGKKKMVTDSSNLILMGFFSPARLNLIRITLWIIYLLHHHCVYL